MVAKRRLSRIEAPPLQAGFLGAGHLVRPVIAGDLARSDPFLFLMDDILDKKDDIPVGGPHPHAGFETVSLLLEGEIGDEAHTMKGGDFQIMTAGSGVIHSEIIDKKSRMRLLQLWVNLPKKDRWTSPRVQDLLLPRVPYLSANGVSIRLYSGSLAGMQSPIQNHVPMIIADIRIQAGVSTHFEIPAHYNTLLYMLEGSLLVGDDQKLLQKDQAGWLNILAPGNSELQLAASGSDAHFVLYSGEPLGEQVISQGPFIGDGPDDIRRLYQEFRLGKMQHIATVPPSQRIMYN